MSVAIIGGRFGSRVLSTPRSIRPTTSRVREALASIVRLQVPQACVLELCAGSGAVGFELLSRGAARCDFVEKSGAVCAVLRKNAQKLAVEDQCRIHRSSAEAFIHHAATSYDLIYFDPPYQMHQLYELVPHLAGIIRRTGTIIVEHPHFLQDQLIAPANFSVRIKKYGKSSLSIFRAEELQ